MPLPFHTNSTLPDLAEPATPRGLWLPALLLAALTLTVHGATVLTGFVWDDFVLVARNPDLHSLQGLAAIWDPFRSGSQDYLPLTYSLWWLEFRMFGGNPAGYHVVHLLLHTTAVLLLWRLFQKLNVPWAWLGALLFAVHPVNVATVAWISETKNTLSLVLLLLSLLAWIDLDTSWQAGEPGSRGRWAAAVGGFTAALLAKSAVVVLPPILLALAWWRHGRLTRRDLAASAPFFLLALGAGLLTLEFQHDRAGGIRAALAASRSGLGVDAAGVGATLSFYLAHLAAPCQVAAIHPRDILVQNGKALAGLSAAWVGLGLLLLACRKRDGCRGLLVMLAIFLACLFPVLGFFPASYFDWAPVADHWAYLALCPLAAGGAAGLHALAGPGRGLRKYAVLAAAGVLAAWFGAQTLKFQQVFRDQKTLWLHITAVNPGHPRAWLALGVVEMDEGNLAGALRRFDTALRLDPRNDTAWKLVGLARQKQNRHAEAAAALKQALILDPGDTETRLQLATALEKSGGLAGAIAEWRDVIRRDPGCATAQVRLSWALSSAGPPELRRPAEALEHAIAAVRLNPRSAAAADALAAALAANGRFPEAARTIADLLAGKITGTLPPPAVGVQLEKRLNAFRQGRMPESDDAP